MNFSIILLRILFVFALSVSTLGCSTQLRTTEQLVGEAVFQVPTRIDKALTILPVKGGEKAEQSIWTVKVPKIDNEKFLRLLVVSLQKSGLFREVSKQQIGDVSLNTEIIFQDITAPGTTNTLMLLVHYELVERESDRVIWKKNIYTQRELSTEDIFVGEERMVRLLEVGLIANMKALIESMGHRLAN